jgi:hypothetical protein
MPPKKKTAATEGGETEGGVWLSHPIPFTLQLTPHHRPSAGHSRTRKRYTAHTWHPQCQYQTATNKTLLFQLLILTQGRYLNAEDYERIVSVFPGTSLISSITPFPPLPKNSPIPLPNLLFPRSHSSLTPHSSHTHTPPNHILTPAGTSVKGVQVRVSKLRVEQRKLYEEYGWTLPDGAAKTKAPVTPRKNNTSTATSTSTPKKRSADADADADAEATSEQGTPKTKKPRTRKPKAGKKEAVVEEEGVEEDGKDAAARVEKGDGDAEVEEPYIPMAKRVKEEVLDEEMV